MAENTVDKKALARTSDEDRALVTRESERFLIPPVDIYDTEDGLALVADMPGVDKKDLDINVAAGVLTIRGKVSREDPAPATYQEFGLLDYYRQFRLTDEVDHDKISAEVNNGVLTLHLPKAEHAKPKKIDVKVG